MSLVVTYTPDKESRFYTGTVHMYATQYFYTPGSMCQSSPAVLPQDEIECTMQCRRKADLAHCAAIQC